MDVAWGSQLGLEVDNMDLDTDSPGTGWLGTVVAFLDDQCVGIPLLGSSVALVKWSFCPSPQSW